MLLILLIPIFVSTLIYGGMRVNLYLYHTGALGASRATYPRHANPIAVESMNNEATAEEQFYMHLDKVGSPSARYARRGVLLLVLILVVVGIVAMSMISAALS